MKNINMLIAAPYFYFSVLLYQLQFDKSFQSVILYDNHLICIFMKIYENLEYKGQSWKNLGIIKTYLATSMFSMGPQNM